MELSEASAALVAIPRGNFTANFDILNELIEQILTLRRRSLRAPADIPLLSLFLEKLTLC